MLQPDVLINTHFKLNRFENYHYCMIVIYIG